tara:strand:+ start:40785 stop:41255 length:471 start_codon:yes stop_codon:yes gene_type:complete
LAFHVYLTIFILDFIYERKILDNRLSTTIDATMPNSELPLDLDDLMTLLAEAYDVPIALIGIVGKQDEVIKASHGTDIEYIPRKNAFCSHVVESGEPLIIPDATKDERFQHSQNVIDDNDVVFYAGTPINMKVNRWALYASLTHSQEVLVINTSHY